MNITRDIDKNIFREYDIRGTYNINVNEDISYTMGKAFGTYIKKFGEDTCIIGHDNRLSSDSMNESLINGVLSTGTNVIDLGLVTTPMFYYSRILKNIKPGIMITASHNPKDDNGFKMSFNTISNAKGKEIFDFRDFVLNGEFDQGEGILYKYDVKDEYKKLFKDNLSFGDRRLKVVIDCGNGTASIIAKDIYSMFSMDLVTIYDESDGSFPNHHPDPIVEENMTALKNKVIEYKADIGIGFDGDGDRAGFVDNNGNIITSDHYAIIVLREILKNNSNKNVLYDVKCSKAVSDEILKLNGIPHESRTGASYTMSTVMDENMIFGIEYSGHIYFNDKFPPISSGLYAGLKLLEILSKTNKNIDELLADTTEYYSTPELKFLSTDDKKWDVIEKIKEYSIAKDYKFSLIDGVKIYFEYGWALVRCSNTGPNVTARFEANTKEKLEEIKNEFVEQINMYN